MWFLAVYAVVIALAALAGGWLALMASRYQSRSDDERIKHRRKLKSLERMSKRNAFRR